MTLWSLWDLASERRVSGYTFIVPLPRGRVEVTDARTWANKVSAGFILSITHESVGNLTLCCKCGDATVRAHSGKAATYPLRTFHDLPTKRPAAWSAPGTTEVNIASNEPPATALLWLLDSGRLHINATEASCKPQQLLSSSTDEFLESIASDRAAYVTLRLFHLNWPEAAIAECISGAIADFASDEPHPSVPEKWTSALIRHVIVKGKAHRRSGEGEYANDGTAACLLSEMRLLAAISDWGVRPDVPAGGSLLDDAKLITTSPLSKTIAFPVYDLLTSLAEWILWIASTAPHEQAPPARCILLAYKSRLQWRLSGSREVDRVAPLKRERLDKLDRDVQRAVCFFWGRQDLLFSLSLWSIKAIEGGASTTRQSETKSESPAEVVELGSLLKSRVVQTSSEATSSEAVALQEVNCRISWLTGVALSRVSGGRCSSSDYAVNWAVSCLVPASEDRLVDSDSESAPSCHSDDWLAEKTVELGWGNRGDGDIFSYWADFYAGVNAAIGHDKRNSESRPVRDLLPKFIEQTRQDLRDSLARYRSIVLRVGAALTSLEAFLNRWDPLEEIFSMRETASGERTSLSPLIEEAPPHTSRSLQENSPLPGTAAVGETADAPLMEEGTLEIPASLQENPSRLDAEATGDIRKDSFLAMCRLYTTLRVSFFTAGSLLGLGLRTSMPKPDSPLQRFAQSQIPNCNHSGTSPLAESSIPSVEMAVENIAHPCNLNSEKLSVPQNTLIICSMLASTFSFLHEGSRMRAERRSYCDGLLEGVYSPNPRAKIPIANFDAHALLCFALLTEPRRPLNELIHSRLLTELEAAASAAFPELHCTDRLTYASDSGPKKRTDEEGCVERRSILLGVAAGILSAKIGGIESTEMTCALALRVWSQDRNAASGRQVLKRGIMDLSTHSAGKSTDFSQECSWGCAIAIGLSARNSSDPGLIKTLRNRRCSYVNPLTFVAGTLALGLICWEHIGFGSGFLSTLFEADVLLQRGARKQAFLASSQDCVRYGRLFDEICPASPLETACSMERLPTLESTDYHHLLQLHALAIGTLSWLCGLRFPSSNASETRGQLLACSRWLRTATSTAADPQSAGGGATTHAEAVFALIGSSPLDLGPSDSPPTLVAVGIWSTRMLPLTQA